MKMQEVRKRANVFGIKTFGKKKLQVIREIQEAEGNVPCFLTAEGMCDQDACCWRGLCLGG